MKILLSPYSSKLKNGKPNPKNYPYWPELVKLLQDAEHNLVQAGGRNEVPLIFNVAFNCEMHKLREFLDWCDVFISVDNFFHHFAHHYGKRGIVLWGPSNPMIFGYPEHVNLVADKKYFRPDQFGQWESCALNNDAFVKPNEVMKAIEQHFKVPTPVPVVMSKDAVLDKIPTGYKLIK